jgi:hypothetical protein
MVRELAADLTAALNWYDGGEADAPRGKVLADSLRAALLAHADRGRAFAAEMAGIVRGPVLSLPAGWKAEQLPTAPTDRDRLLTTAATLLAGRWGGVHPIHDSDLKSAVAAADRLMIQVDKFTAGPTPPPPPPPEPADALPAFALRYLEWLSVNGPSLATEGPPGVDATSHGDARRVLTKHKLGHWLDRTDGGVRFGPTAEGLAKVGVSWGGGVKLAEVDERGAECA